VPLVYLPGCRAVFYLLPDIAAGVGFGSGFIGSQSTPLSLRSESGKSSIIPAVALMLRLTRRRRS